MSLTSSEIRVYILCLFSLFLEEEMRVTPSSFKSEMERVLIKVVAVTEHYSVTSLERIHSAICNLIYKHRANEDKNMLIKVSYVSCHTVRTGYEKTDA